MKSMTEPLQMSVIGCGYLGAVHAAGMAKLGHRVVGIDIDEKKIANLAAAQAPFFERGLPELLREGMRKKRLSFSTNFSAAAKARVHFLAVGTPQETGGFAADLSYLWSAVEQLMPHLKKGDLVVGKSTVPVGTAEAVAEKIAATGAMLAWSPEFIREGFAVKDTLSPDRLVYGLPPGKQSKRAKKLLDRVFADMIDRQTPVVVTDYATAELVKSAANAFLATKISFINAMAEIAEASGADVLQLSEALGHDNRIGKKFLGAGVGFGGGCLPKDIRAFVARAEELGRGESVSFLKEVDAINLRRRDRVVSLAEELLGGDVRGKTIAVLGLAFKPNSDDIRDSPALEVAVRLEGMGAKVRATDPEAVENARLLYPRMNYAHDLNDAVTGADLVLLLTEWSVYKKMRPKQIGELVNAPVILDGRNALNRETWLRAGWHYQALGRASGAKLDQPAAEPGPLAR